MKREWQAEELMEQWTLRPGDWHWVGNKHGPTRLGCAVLLKCCQCEGRFPRYPHEVPPGIVAYVAPQVGISPEAWATDEWHGRSLAYHRAQIRQHVGCREATVADGQALITWLCEHVLVTPRRPEHLKEVVDQRSRELHIEPPTLERIDRLIGSAVHLFDTRRVTRCSNGCPPRPSHTSMRC